MRSVPSIVELPAPVAWIALLAAIIVLDRRVGIAVRERYRWRSPAERYIEDGDRPMPSPAEFRWIARMAVTRNSDPHIERLRRWQLAILVAWMVCSVIAGSGILFSN
jgi:hypothetical protein